MPDSPHTSIFSDRPEEEPIAQYRGVSVLAVIALLVSLVSAAAMLGPLLWPIPLVGASLAALALAKIASAEPKPLGRSLAVAALFTSLLFGAAAPSHYFFRQHRVRDQAQKVGEEWFALLGRQQYAAALELTVPPLRREPLTKDLDKLYADDPDRSQRLANFIDDPANALVRRLTILLQDGAEIEFDQVQHHTSSGGTDHLRLIYRVTDQQAGEPQSMRVRLVVKRDDDPGTARGQWQIVGWEEV